jgi:hypothetical protein
VADQVARKPLTSSASSCPRAALSRIGITKGESTRSEEVVKKGGFCSDEFFSLELVMATNHEENEDTIR